MRRKAAFEMNPTLEGEDVSEEALCSAFVRFFGVHLRDWRYGRFDGTEMGSLERTEAKRRPIGKMACFDDI